MGFQPAFANNNNISIGKEEQQPSNVTFMKTFGGKSVDVGYYVQQTTDNGFIIVGETWSFNNYPGDFLLIKTDRYGNKLWQRSLEEQDTRELGSCVQQTSDGEYIITGTTYSYNAGYFNLLLIKTDRYGFKVWDKTIGGANYDFGFYVRQTTEGGYIITG